jgi:uncharacterized protein
MSMEPVYLPHLSRRQDRTQQIIVDASIADLDTLTPVRGTISLRHGGNFLEVSAQAETIVTLKCDRCLCQYNHKLRLDIKETIWLDRHAETDYDSALEIEIPADELVESLPPDGHFDPETWLYEQFCLALPHRNICNDDCEGIATPSTAAVLPTAEATVDRRWQVLANFRADSDSPS